MIDELWRMNAIRSDRVATAFAQVGRHVFAPGVPLHEVYAPTTAVKTKYDEHGAPTSSISAPQIQAFMLEQANIQPGMHVLEVGSGGVNAAMMAELVGKTGSVTTMDIDPEITDRAHRFLDAAGYSRVRVACGDAEHGLPGTGPFDAILVTVGFWDIPPELTKRLAERGRLVVPLRMRGLTCSVALQREAGRLVSHSAELCGFVKIQGRGAHQELIVPLHGDQIGLRFDDDNIPINPDLLAGALSTDGIDAWSGVTVAGMEAFDTLQLWLATVLPGFCLLTANDYDPTTADGPALSDANSRWFPTAFVDDHGDSFAYLISTRRGEDTFELGSRGFGPHGHDAAMNMSEQIRIWDRAHRRDPKPVITVDQDNAGTDAVLDTSAKVVINKRHSRVTISWPPLNTHEVN